MDKLSIIQLSMISNNLCIQLSKYPWYQLSTVSNYPSIHDIQVSMVSNYPDIRKKWYPLIPSYYLPPYHNSGYLAPFEVLHNAKATKIV